MGDRLGIPGAVSFSPPGGATAVASPLPVEGMPARGAARPGPSYFLCLVCFFKLVSELLVLLTITRLRLPSFFFSPLPPFIYLFFVPPLPFRLRPEGCGGRWLALLRAELFQGGAPGQRRVRHTPAGCARESHMDVGVAR